jgi:hypothetical protein
MKTLIQKAFEKYHDDFGKKMRTRAESGNDLLFGEQSEMSVELPKMSDLKSFRNTDQFKAVKESMRPEVESKLSSGGFSDSIKVKAGDDFMDSQIAEVFDTDVYGSFPTSDMWEDFSVDEIKAMVDELRSMGLGGQDILDYFGLMGGADNNAIKIVEALVK